MILQKNAFSTLRRVGTSHNGALSSTWRATSSNSSQFCFAAAQMLVLQVRSMSVDTEPAVMHHHSAPFVPTDSNLTMLACLQAWWRMRIHRELFVSWAMSERYKMENLHERISLRSYDAAPC